MVDKTWQGLRRRVAESRAAGRLQSLFAPWAMARRLAVLFGAVVAMAGLAFPWRARWVWQAEPGVDAPPANLPDGELLPYAPQEVMEILGKLPKPDFYAFSELSLDVFFPWLYGTLLGALMVYLAHHHRDRRARPSFAIFLPPLAVLCDLIENLAYSAVALGAGKPVAVVGVAASWGKWALAIASLLAVAVTGRFLLGRLIGHLMAIRVPLLALVVYGALVYLAGERRLPTVANMMVAEGPFGLFVGAFATVLTLAVILAAGWLAWSLAPERLRCERIELPQRLREHPSQAIALLLPLLALPMLWRLSTATAGETLPKLAALGLGVVVAGALLWLLEKVRRLGVLQRLANVFVPFFQVLGPGYLDFAGGRREARRGHPFALGVGVVLLVVYAIGYFKLEPTLGPRTLPVIAYVLLLLALVTHLLTGIAFFLDRFRFPLFLGLVLYVSACSILERAEHTYPVRLAVDDKGPTVTEALESRLRADGVAAGDPVLLTVIGASGGGIQAAGWTAQVLTGLEAALGPELTRSIHFISAASGGSVGTLYFLEALGPDGVLRPGGGGAVRAAAMSSSLDASAWGLVFPDFLRAFATPLASPTRDRAWALEQRWLHHLQCLEDELGGRRCRAKPNAEVQPWLSSWRSGAAAGRLPGVVFNATFVQDGEPFLISNLDFSERAFEGLGEHWSAAPRDLDHRRHFAPDGSFDLPLVTAARLSATFPWVTPTARPRAPDLEAYRVTDGGFFDNFGTTAALAWLVEAVPWLEDRGHEVRVLYLQASAFPEAPGKPPRRASWVAAAADPVTTIVKVRTSTQRARSDLELELVARLMQKLGVAFEAVSFRPVEAAKPPVSWELSRQDKRDICESWRDPENQRKVDHLRSHFPSAPRPLPGEELPECSDSGR